MNLGQIYQLREIRETEWNPTVRKEEPERPLFKFETKVIKKIMKPELLQELNEIDRILYTTKEELLRRTTELQKLMFIASRERTAEYIKSSDLARTPRYRYILIILILVKL